MKMIALIIMVAVVLEAVVEYAKTIMKMVENKEYKTAITQGIVILLAIGFAFGFNLQLFNGAMSEFYEGLIINPIFDKILTGILFSRGANFFSDLVSKLKNPNSISVVDDPYEDYLGTEDDFDDYMEVEEVYEQENIEL